MAPQPSPTLQVAYKDLKRLAEKFAGTCHWFGDLIDFADITTQVEWPQAAGKVVDVYNDACDTMAKTGRSGSRATWDTAAALDKTYETYTKTDTLVTVNIEAFPWAHGDYWFNTVGDQTDVRSYGTFNGGGSDTYLKHGERDVTWSTWIVEPVQVIAGVGGAIGAIRGIYTDRKSVV